MRLRVVHKLIALMLLLVATALTSLALATAINLRHGFVGYLNQLDLQRLQPLRQALRAHLDSGGKLDDYRRPARWHRLLQRHLERRPPAPDGAMGPPPPPPRPPATAGPTATRPPPPPGGPPALRVSLLDAAGQVLAGPQPATDATRQPLRVGDHVAGYLALSPLRRPSGRLDSDFLHAQSRQLAWTAAWLALLVLLAAAAFARHLLAPLRAVTTATAKLAAGDFAVRLRSRRHDELGDLLRHVDTVAHALAQQEDARRRWMADMSHELRTPLAILRGEIEAMQDGVVVSTPAAIASLHEEVLRLERLVGDLHQLALGQLGALAAQRQSCDPAALAAAAAARFSTRLRHAGLQLETVIADDIGAMQLDGGRFGQLLDNLLENSLRYTATGGRVRLQMNSDGQWLRVRVEDSAPGVADDDRVRLFEPLFRAEGSRDRRHGGSGLGLAICHSIVAAHGGHIRAVASALGGLRIDVELPQRLD